VEFGKLSVENPAVFGQDGAGLLQIFFIVENAGGAALVSSEMPWV